MKKKKVLLVFGTRPEAIKMAPVVHEFLRHQELFDTKVCVTAQHREMLDQVLRIFNIKPDFDLNIMKPNQDLFDITAGVLLGIREVMLKVNPDVVFVHGDTTTSMAVSLAGFYLRIPVAHVEAGLRTYDLHAPWPEEMNRQVTDRITTYHLAPTGLSRQNLVSEGLPEDNICVTGNTVIDALHFMVDKIDKDPELKNNLTAELISAGYNPESINTRGQNRRMILVTGHRRENFGEGFESLCRAIAHLADAHADVEFIYPVHLNPHVQEPVFRILGKRANIHLIAPLDYKAFVWLMDRSCFLLSDSGGIQEEAPHLAKPVLVMRETTERPEAVEAGTAKLVGTDYAVIVREVSVLLDNKAAYAVMSQARNPFGDGHAARRIADVCSEVRL